MKEIDRDKFHVEAKPEENTLYLNNREKKTLQEPRIKQLKNKRHIKTN